MTYCTNPGRGDAEILMVNNKNLLCIVDYYSKFPVIKMVASLYVDDIVHAAKITFTELELPRKFISDLEMNFTSEIF